VAARFLIDAGWCGWGISSGVCLSVRRADAAVSPSTPASLLLQKKTVNTSATIQAAVPECLPISSFDAPNQIKNNLTLSARVAGVDSIYEDRRAEVDRV
jgi:hypothetical protein